MAASFVTDDSLFAPVAGKRINDAVDSAKEWGREKKKQFENSKWFPLIGRWGYAVLITFFMLLATVFGICFILELTGHIESDGTWTSGERLSFAIIGGFSIVMVHILMFFFIESTVGLLENVEKKAK